MDTHDFQLLSFPRETLFVVSGFLFYTPSTYKTGTTREGKDFLLISKCLSFLSMKIGEKGKIFWKHYLPCRYFLLNIHSCDKIFSATRLMYDGKSYFKTNVSGKSSHDREHTLCCTPPCGTWFFLFVKKKSFAIESRIGVQNPEAQLGYFFFWHQKIKNTALISCKKESLSLFWTYTFAADN